MLNAIVGSMALMMVILGVKLGGWKFWIFGLPGAFVLGVLMG